jgi:hypothetical protein
MLVDLKKDPVKFSELLKRIEELENAGGGDHHQNIRKNPDDESGVFS